MAYLVKTVLGEPMTMELAQIRDALKSGVIHENWLAREARQDFWYSVSELLGLRPTAKLTFFCPKCEGPIATRRIDIGLPVGCAKCGAQIVVPDPEAARDRQRDEHELAAARQRVFFGSILLAAGLITTGSAFWLRQSFGGVWVVWLGPLFGGGLLLQAFLPRFLSLRKRLRPPHPKLDEFTQRNNGRRAARDP